MITATAVEIKDTMTLIRLFFKDKSPDELLARRVEYSEKKQEELSLYEWCFLFLSSMQKMFGDINLPEVERYFIGLELIGYPIEFLITVASGKTYPLAELSAYMDEHKYEIYQMQNQVRILKSIDLTLKNIFDFISAPRTIIEEQNLLDKEVRALEADISVVPITELSLADRVKARMQASEGNQSDEKS